MQNIIIQLIIFKMSLTQQYIIQALLSQSIALVSRQEKEAQSTLYAKIDKINDLLTQNIRETFSQYSQQVIIKFAEVTVEIPQKIHYSEEIIRLYFQRFRDSNQFFIRALLVKARLVAINGHRNKKKAQQMIEVLRQAISFISKALDIIAGPQQISGKGKDSKGDPQSSNKQKYSFLIYNASNCLYKIVRFMLRTNWQKNFTDIIQRIYKLFEQLDEPDHNWRSRFTLILFQCLYDAEKKPEAFKILDILWQKTKNKPCDFQDNLFRLRVHLTKQNKALQAIIKKDIQGPNDQKGWKSLQMIQKIKSGITPQNLIQKQLTTYLNTVSTAILLQNNDNSVGNLTSIVQQRLAQIGRIALQFNLVQIGDKVFKYLNRVRQPSQKSMVLNQYNKAELLIKRELPAVDPKTNMKYNSIQLKLQEIQNRSLALKTLEKVMIINKRLNDPDLIYEGSILIWNLSLPFMTPSHRENITKAFQISCNLLQQIDNNDHAFRTKLHLQLAKSYFSNQSQFFRVEQHILKALSLDSSIPLSKLPKIDGQQDSSLYQRPYQRYIWLIKEKAQLKKNNFERTMTDLDRVVMDLWNVIGQKSQNTRIDILQKCLGNIVNIQQKEYNIQQAKQRFLVQQEIKLQQVKHKQNNLKQFKKKKLLAAEIAELAFQWQINQVAEKACQFVIGDKWQVANAQQMILAQVKCYFFLAQIQIDYMINDNFEVAFLEPQLIEEEQQKKNQLSSQKKQEILQKKKKIASLLSKGLNLADSIQQSWLIFNGAIYIWNNFLHVFKDPTNDSKLLPQITQLLKQYFESMKNSLKQSEKKQIISYDLQNKLQIFANIGLIYARLMEAAKQNDEVNRICQIMSSNQQLSPHTKKLINSIKSRVSPKGSVQKPPDNKGNKGAPIQGSTNNTDQILFDIVSLLEIIKNSGNKSDAESLIRKCFQTLQNWKAKENDETQLQLHAELWAKLARLALNEGMYKYSLRSVQYSLSLLSPKVDLQTIPHNRLRWYSLSQYLYSQNLAKIVNPQTQEVENCQKLLFSALDHAVQAANKGYKCKINSLVLDASKQVWNVSSRLQQSATNRRSLIKPIYSTLTYLKQLKEKSQTDLLLLLSQLFFKCCIQNQQYKLGETAADMLFELIPKSFQKPLWEAKMIFMSKQNKNELQAISNMKEADASLQAKLYVKLARVSTNIQKQYSSYNKAIQILKKQNSVQIVEVLIQYAEWQLRTGKEKVISVIGNLLLASDYLIDIQFGEQGQQQANIQQQRGTVFSRSTRGKKSQYSNTPSQKSKLSKQKKNIQKKSQISNSNKSKGSRMNRSARITKTLKSKNTKSIFAQRQEQSNPQSLNCAHYQRLFRIHTILAQISSNTQDRIRYCFDAKSFLIKILQVSFKTLNTMDENASKYANIIEQKKVQQQFIKKYKMPETIDDWLKLTLSKEFIQKVKTYQDYNFMGIYLFDKMELTFSYILQLINMLQNYSYHIQTIPLYFFLRFMAKQILSNGQLSMACDIKFALTLKKCNYLKEIYDPIILNSGISKFKLTDLEKKSHLAKTNSIKSNFEDPQSSDNLVQTISVQNQKPNLVKPYSQRTYQIWIMIAIYLIDYGEIPKAKQLLKQSVKHAKILADLYNMCRCHLYLSKIAYLQGQLNQAVNLVIITTKMCKNIELWEEVFRITFIILNKLRKYEDIKKFTNSIKDVITKLIKQAQDPKTQIATHEHQLIQLYQLYNTINLYSIKYSFKLLKSEPSRQKFENFLDSLSIVQSSLNDPYTTLLTIQYKFFAELAIKMFIIFEETNFDAKIQDSQKIVFKAIKKIQRILLIMQLQILNALKYSSIGIQESVFFNKNSFINVHHQIRLVLARAHTLQGIFKRLKLNLGGDDQQKNQIYQVPDYEPLKKYLQHLNLQIQKSLSLVPKRLESFQTSISILVNLQSKLNKDSYLYIIWGIQMAAAKRRLAQAKEQLQQVWNPKETNSQEDKIYATESLKHIHQFLQQYENKIDNLNANTLSFNYAKRVYFEMVQNTGLIIPQKCFQYLIKSQHYSYSEHMKSQLKESLDKTNKLITYPRLLKKTIISPLELQSSITNIPLFSNLTKFPEYSECIKMLPNNHMILVLQLSADKKYLYFSRYSNTKYDKQLIVIKRIQLKQQDHKQYQNIKKQLYNIKFAINRIPIDEHQIKKYYELLNQKQAELSKILERFQNVNRQWTSALTQYLEKKREQPIQQIDPKQQKKGKDMGKASKKGGKDEITSYQSPLPATLSGIDNITLLIDYNLYSLPYQSLQCFTSVSSIGRDLSLFYLCRKLKQLSYKPQLNNSSGWQADKTKFIAYDYKKQQLNAQSILNDVSKDTPTFKFQGIGSNKRIPSLAQYQKLSNTGTILHFYGFPSFCNLFTIKNILSTLQMNKLKLMIINDNLNFKKIYLNKFDRIDQGEIIKSQEQQLRLIDALNLLNISTIKNRWSIKLQNIVLIMKKLYKNLGEQIYIGGALRKLDTVQHRLLQKLMLIYNGPPMIRI